MLKDKMAQALEMFGPTEDALNQAGIEFVHPAEEVEDGNMNRRSKMVEYRAHLAKQEEVKIAAEREELKRSKMLQSQQHPAARCSRSRSSNTLACFCISPKTNVQP
ncbi:putative Paraflagellar rod protein [Trypanosoma vivax]|nr:putative Paraflagellar rod protein [Trypanosoma vivax]